MFEMYIVLMSSNNNQFLGLFQTLQDAQQSVINQYKQIGVVTFAAQGSKNTLATISNSLNTILIRAIAPEGHPKGLEGF